MSILKGLEQPPNTFKLQIYVVLLEGLCSTNQETHVTPESSNPNPDSCMPAALLHYN